MEWMADRRRGGGRDGGDGGGGGGVVEEARSRGVWAEMRTRGVVLRWHGGLCNAIWCGVEGPRQQGNRPLPHVGAAALCRRVRARE